MFPGVQVTQEGGKGWVAGGCQALLKDLAGVVVVALFPEEFAPEAVGLGIPGSLLHPGGPDVGGPVGAAQVLVDFGQAGIEGGVVGVVPQGQMEFFEDFIHQAQFFQKIGPGQMHARVPVLPGVPGEGEFVGLVGVARGEGRFNLCQEGGVSHGFTFPKHIQGSGLQTASVVHRRPRSCAPPWICEE